uniref:Putative RNA ligase n=1 Tax=viral metagenome TaxID=1070528 RepID=A0A6M3JE66_9ZZZZ
MIEYHKINSIFKRDPLTKYKTFLMGQYSTPELEYLKDNEWVFTEKVDGTNIRIMWNHEMLEVTFGGKTDNAQIPAALVNRLKVLFTASEMEAQFPDNSVCLYGEGYGPKIQKGGGNYRQDQSFVLFDVRIGHWWLQRHDIKDLGDKLGIDTVPIVGYGTLNGAVSMAQAGFSSQWGDFIAEGIVARPKVELKARSGERIITKVKHKDFIKEIKNG